MLHVHMGRRHLIVMPVLGMAVALGAGGCATLLGIQDRTEVDDDASVDTPGVDGSMMPTHPATAEDASVEDGPRPDGSGMPPSDATNAPDTSTAPDARTGSPEAAAPDAAACGDPCDMADGLDEPYMVTSDAYNVYWVEFGDTFGAGNGSLKACAVGGCGGTPTVWQANLMDPRGVAVDASNVYWGTTWGGIAGAMGAIWSCNVALGAAGCASPTKLATSLDPTSLSVDTSYVYWVDSNLDTVHRVRTNGTGTDDVLYAPPDGGLGAFLDAPVVCAVDATNLYIVDASANSYYLAKAGGTPVLLQRSAAPITSTVTVDGQGSAYFTQQGRILKGSATGSELPLVVNGTGVALNQAVGLVVDVTSQVLYWADYGSGVANDGAIGRATLLGANPTLLQSKLETPTSVTVSGNYTYWLSAGTLLASTSTTTSYVQTSTGKLWRTHK